MLSNARWITISYRVLFLDSQGLPGTRTFYSEEDVIAFISDNRKIYNSFRLSKECFAELDCD